jgi:ArsR family transcriptional regulator
MKLVQIYQCLCDPTRLRILNLLAGGPLCVCHIQEVLGESQVKVSKHLAYLRQHGMAEARREANWMIYSLPAKRTRELQTNLACLQDCAREERGFVRDTTRLAKLRARLAADCSACPECCAPGKTLSKA